ncbi:MAG TPA: DUF2203 domain-containing protein [Chloroflexota bacterium]|nr:DUF2203 domain-containing protein [Chloroflexota bacterium]
MAEREAEERLYTLEEARAALPRVRELMAEIRERMMAVGALQERLEELRERKRRGEHDDNEGKVAAQALAEANRLGQEIQERAVEVQEMGVEIKDLRTGLVDFRSRRDERVVYLCWRLGEDEIEYWHELDTGFAGRQPL